MENEKCGKHLLMFGIFVDTRTWNKCACYVGMSTEVVEHCCSVTSLQLGETLPNISRDLDTHSYRLPLGVTAGITPFNFPAMIPLWMFPVAVVLGNTSVIKPSERDPGACMMLMQLLNEAGCPPGVVNVIHGAHEAVTFVCDNPDIKAISFVGSDLAVSICLENVCFFLEEMHIKSSVCVCFRQYPLEDISLTDGYAVCNREQNLRATLS